MEKSRTMAPDTSKPLSVSYNDKNNTHKQGFSFGRRKINQERFIVEGAMKENTYIIEESTGKEGTYFEKYQMYSILPEC
jgi:hypothetical protein